MRIYILLSYPMGAKLAASGGSGGQGKNSGTGRLPHQPRRGLYHPLPPSLLPSAIFFEAWEFLALKIRCLVPQNKPRFRVRVRLGIFRATPDRNHV